MQGGPEGAPVIIFLHGFPDYHESWRFQVSTAMELGYRVICPDMRGYNTSDKPPNVEDYAREHLVADILGLVNWTGQAKVRLVGHDWGGAVVYMFLEDHGDRVEQAMILNAPHMQSLMNKLRFDTMQVFRSWYIWYFQQRDLPEELIIHSEFVVWRHMFKAALGERYTAEEDVKYHKVWTQPGALTAMINYYRNLPEFIKNEDYREINTPVLVVWGTNDENLGPELGQEGADFCKNGRIEYVEEGGHFVHWKNPDVVNRHMSEFFGSAKIVSKL